MRTSIIIAIILIYPIFAWADSAVFDYDDFGPQISAYETIGFQWYQWNNSGDSDPYTIDDIKVVVYWDESIDDIKKQYPVDPKRKKDFRYLGYDTAINHLDAVIAEMGDEQIVSFIKNRLLSTKNTLQKLRTN